MNSLVNTCDQQWQYDLQDLAARFKTIQHLTSPVSQDLSKFVNPNYLSTKMPVDLEDVWIWGSRQCFVNIISSLIFSILHFGLCFYFSNCVFGLQNCRKLCEAIRWMRWPDFPGLKEQQEGWCWRAVFDVPLRLLQYNDCHRASRGFKCMEFRITKEMWRTSSARVGFARLCETFLVVWEASGYCILIIRIFIRIILKFLVPLWLGYWYVAIAVSLFAHWLEYILLISLLLRLVS